MFLDIKYSFAIIIPRSTTVLLYRLTLEDGCHGFKYLERLDMSAAVLDVTFDEGGRLWLLKSEEGSMVSVYAATQDDPIVSHYPINCLLLFISGSPTHTIML